MNTGNYPTKTVVGGVAVNNVIDAMSTLTITSKRIRPSLETSKVTLEADTSTFTYARRRVIAKITLGMNSDHDVTLELPVIVVDNHDVTDLTQLLVAYEPLINHIRDYENEFILIVNNDKHYIYYISMNIYTPVVLTSV